MTQFPLAERVRQTCRRFADRTLLRDDNHSLDGSACGQRIDELTEILATLTPEGGRVGILFFNTAARGLAILAALAAKRVPVILDASDRFRQLERHPEKLGLGALVTSIDDFEDAPRFTSTVFLHGDGKLARLEAEPLLDTKLPRPGTALILYTSGSTGERKGVQVPAAGLLYTVDYLIRYFSLDQNTRSLVLLPLCHSMGLNTQFLPTFFAGGESYFVEISISLNRCYRALVEYRPTFIGMISELLLICREERSRRELEPLESVRHLQLAGGMIRQEHLHVARDLFPQARLHKGYGLTEAIRVSMTSSEDETFFGDNAGYLLPMQQLEVRDGEGNVLPAGTPGQIFIASPNVMLGYDNVPDSPIGGDGFLDTGDLGALMPDGRLVIHGRGGSLFKIAGDWVSAMEIERAAAASSELVRDVKCLPVPDAKLGHRSVLFVEVAPPQKRAFLEAGRRYLETTLTDRFPRVWLPKDVYVMEKFPRTASGKLQNHVLKELLRRDDAEHAPRQPGVRYRVVEDPAVAGNLTDAVRAARPPLMARPHSDGNGRH